jgi:hypothetical protein
MPRRRKKNEKQLLDDYLKSELDKKNIVNFPGNPRNLKGFPDRIVFGKIVYYIELKLGKENDSYYKQTQMQKKWELQINQTNNKYFLINTRNEIDELVELIYQECLKYEIKNHFAYNKEITRDEK